nr:reverse transcriptase domain-containing protein [Tanacetum cinerariifolium]
MRKRRLSTPVTGQIGRNLKIYVDDLVIKSHTETELLRDIKETFRTLRRIKMKINPKKYKFRAAEEMFLGYMISPKGIKPCPDKTKALLQLPSPRTIKENSCLYQFLYLYLNCLGALRGMPSFFRLTGEYPSWISIRCSAIDRGTPVMSDGCHANISKFPFKSMHNYVRAFVDTVPPMVFLSDGVLVSVHIVAPQGLAILLADAATQTKISKDEASPRLLRTKSLPPLYNLDWP